MYSVKITRSFRKDIKRCKKQGKDLQRFKDVSEMLMAGKMLPEKYRDHLLTGNWKNHRDCHLAPDWILLYRMNEEAKEIEFIRTGSHAELFE